MNTALRLLLSSLSIAIGSHFLSAQAPSSFSDNPEVFLKELKEYMLASKNADLEKVYNDFAPKLRQGLYSEPEFNWIHQVCNEALDHKVPANPYFGKYLENVISLKFYQHKEIVFVQWHEVYWDLLKNTDQRRFKPLKSFLEFSLPFLEKQALRYSTSGVSWYFKNDFSLVYEEGEAIVCFENAHLTAVYKKDTIQISNAKGAFFVEKELWKGYGGKGTLVSTVKQEGKSFSMGGSYQVELDRTQFQVDSVLLDYPELFPGKTILGTYQDKLFSGNNEKMEASYPRFESLDSDLQIGNIGKGIDLHGGLRIHGNDIYAFGSSQHKACLLVSDQTGLLQIKAQSESFAIHKEENLAAEGVNCVLYFGQDSLTHPSVGFKFDISEHTLTLARGKKDSDRNPFYSSHQKVNIDVDNIQWLMGQDSLVLGHRQVSFTKVERKLILESAQYFDEADYIRLQNISSTNPISVIKQYADQQGSRLVDAKGLAQQFNPRFEISNINSLLYDLVSKGFINYDKDQQTVEVKDKIFHYADASQNLTPYDLLRIESVTDSTNAVWDLKNNTITATGVPNLLFSPRHNVALKPHKSTICLKENRNMLLAGKLFAGFSTFIGKDFAYSYDDNKMELDSIRYFDVFVPSGKVDQYGRPIALSISSRIENASGVLLIDAPFNKSGNTDIDFFPAFKSKKKAYVYYDQPETLDGCYSRDSFYFQLDPFSLNNLDQLKQDDLHFKGKMVSAGIFSEFEETLLLEETDQSFGFKTETPKEGYPNYQGKGRYKGSIELSNKGFLGKGNIQYLGASIDSEDIVFKPRQMTSTADQFNLEEDRQSEVKVPQTKAYDVSIDWHPYVDSMYIRSKERPFELFKEASFTLEGLQILTPGGLKGRGQFNWDQGKLYSSLMTFGAFSTKADTANLQIVSFGSDDFAFDTQNVQTKLDFDRQKGWVKANNEDHITTMPYNKYLTNLDEFVWEMKAQTITFQNEKNLLGDFTSFHPDQDSLHFQGASAFYDLKNNELQIGGVPFLRSADAFIYPDSGKVEIRPGGEMATLDNARIVADTLSKYHVINRAKVKVMGLKEYRASGFYEYPIGERRQEIEFKDIVGTRMGKGKQSEKRSLTRATGTVGSADHFYIDQKTEFRGTISLKAEDINLSFDGFARIDSPILPNAKWFSVKCEADKHNLYIEYEQPKDEQGLAMATGIYLHKETARMYPSVMDALYYGKDRLLFEAKVTEKGLFRYDTTNDLFIFGDSLRVRSHNPFGNIFTLSNKTGAIHAKGQFQIAPELEFVKLTAAGELKTQLDHSRKATAGPLEVSSDLMLMTGIDLEIPDKLLKILITDLQAAIFDARPVDYQKNIDFHCEALATFVPTAKDLETEIESLKRDSELDLPSKYNKFAFLLSYLPMKWNPESQSLYNTTETIGLASINGTKINRMLKGYVEFKMPSNEEDRVYIYLQSPSEDWYYFACKQGVLSIASSNVRFNDVLAGMKEKERMIKQKDGTDYEIQAVDANSVQLFVNRMKTLHR